MPVSPAGTDGGTDIIAHKVELGFEPPIMKVQVKSGENTPTGDPAVKALYGNVAPQEFGLFVTLGSFTNQAKQFACGKANLRLIDQQDLIQLTFQHYKDLRLFQRAPSCHASWKIRNIGGPIVWGTLKNQSSPAASRFAP